MSNYNYPSGPRGRAQDQGMPFHEYNDPYRQQRPTNVPDIHISHQDQGYYNPQAHGSYGSYYVEDVPLTPPQSHFATSYNYAPRNGPPPQRPPRPDYPSQAYIPPSQQRRHEMYQQFFPESQQSYHDDGQWNDMDYAAPGAQQPRQGGLQALVDQLHRRAPLGPPPSARRGPSSYYEQTEPIVHPIAEENESTKGSTNRGSHRSALSNNAIPIGVQSVYLDDGNSSIYSRTPSMYPHPHQVQHWKIPDEDLETLPTDNRTSGMLNRSDEIPAHTLVRKASLGMTTKPRITTVTTPKKRETADSSLSDADTARRRAFPLVGAGERQEPESPIESRHGSETPELQQQKLYSRSHGGSSDALGTVSLTDLTASDSDEPESLAADRPSKKRLTPSKPLHRSISPLVPLEFRNDDNHGSQTLPRSGSSGLLTPTADSAFRKDKKRPPHLNIEAVRDAEQRGSLTSLPDLIKRATRLASNLDRGKTASRLGMSAWLGTGLDINEKGRPFDDSRRSAGSLTDMLAAFPPPAAGTSTSSKKGNEKQRRSTPRFSSHLRHSTLLPSDSDSSTLDKRRGNRCCGTPLWLFILLVCIGICLVATAIVVPVVLIVVPEQRNAAAANTTAICEQKYACQNGGSSIVSTSGDCQCLCINGYTDSTCGSEDSTGCYTVTIGSMSNVTVGSSIPRIIDDAYSNFSIPLDSSALLGLFSSSSLSCASENALITFNSLSQRSLPKVKRQDSASSTTSSAAGTVTSNGIVFADGTAVASTTTASSTTTTSSSATASSTVTTSSHTLDFARVVVLYMLQSTGSLNSSIAAQQNFQNFFSASDSSLASASSLGLGSGFSADLSTFQLTLANGTTVGGSTA